MLLRLFLKLNTLFSSSAVRKFLTCTTKFCQRQNYYYFIFIIFVKLCAHLHLRYKEKMWNDGGKGMVPEENVVCCQNVPESIINPKGESNYYHFSYVCRWQHIITSCVMDCFPGHHHHHHHLFKGHFLWKCNQNNWQRGKLCMEWMKSIQSDMMRRCTQRDEQRDRKGVSPNEC